MFITDPNKFAEWFNESISDACRRITTDDVCLMADCKLIGRFRSYGRQDLETVRGILQYEQMREKRSAKLEIRGKRDEAKEVNNVPNCKRCGQALPPEERDKRGRPREYCPDCESVRSRERYKRWWMKRQTSIRRIPSGTV